jgi:hypothetical protein
MQQISITHRNSKKEKPNCKMINVIIIYTNFESMQVLFMDHIVSGITEDNVKVLIIG